LKYTDIKYYEKKVYLVNSQGYFSAAILDTSTGKFFSNMVSSFSDMERMNMTLDSGNYSNYMSLNLFKIKKRTEESVLHLNGLLFDFDDGDLSLIDKIEKELGVPTWKIGTTPSKNKFQLVYLFDKQLDANVNDYLQRWKDVSYSLSKHFNADHTFDVARVFRIPLSVNGKNGERTTFQENDESRKPFEFFEDYVHANNIKIKAEKVKKVKVKSSKTTTQKNITASKEYQELYQKILTSKSNDNSKARYVFIQTLINKRFNDVKIKSICNEMCFDVADTERIISKIRK
jgi:hypothetical protein